MDKQLVMNEAEQHEIEQLRQSAQCVLDFYKGLTDSRRDLIPMTLFRAVAELTLDISGEGVELRDIRFTPKDLLNKVITIGFLQKVPKESDVSDWVLRNWRNLERELERRKEHLQEFSILNDMPFYAWVGKEESTGGPTNHSLYYLVAQPFDDNKTVDTKKYTCPEGGLHYVPESLSNIPVWARWINGFAIKGWQKFAFLLPVLIVVLFSLFLFYMLLILGINSKISTVSWLSYWLITGGLIGSVLSSPLYRVVSHRIVMAPDWMIPLKERSVQLELKRVDTDPETGNAIRELRLMVYSAKCPICSGRVEVEGGGIEFPFRLIGRCRESPREHIFSFDHVTKTGNALRAKET